MNRIREHLGSKPGKLLVPFFTVGYPTLRRSLDLVRTSIDAGASFVELGMPFSDPMADGPQIQYSSHVAIEHGANLRQVLKAVESIRRKSNVPLILMGYYNPVLAYGPERFARAASSAGADGFIIPDLPADEAAEFTKPIEANDLSAIFLVAPTTTPKRTALIDRHSTDLVYAVTVAGVTGSGRGFDKSTDRYLARLKKTLNKPFVAGFGVSSADSAKRLCRFADGAVIGSALIKSYRGAANHRTGTQRVQRLLKSIRRAL